MKPTKKAPKTTTKPKTAKKRASTAKIGAKKTGGQGKGIAGIDKKVSGAKAKSQISRVGTDTTAQKVSSGKHPGGRPTEYKDEYCELATKFCLLGADDEDLARMFDVDVRTIYRWKDERPEFCQAIKAGKDIADAEVSSKLYHRARGYSHNAVKIVADAKTGSEHVVPYVEHYPPDTTACIFWLKNRQRAKWRDKQDHEHDIPAGGVIDQLFGELIGSEASRIRPT